MISNVVVSYRVKPEAVAEHVRLIEAVFDQLRAEQRTDVDYKVHPSRGRRLLRAHVDVGHTGRCESPPDTVGVPGVRCWARRPGRDTTRREARRPHRGVRPRAVSQVERRGTASPVP